MLTYHEKYSEYFSIWNLVFADFSLNLEKYKQ
jgi:hypothetical protein